MFLLGASIVRQTAEPGGERTCASGRFTSIDDASPKESRARALHVLVWVLWGVLHVGPHGARLARRAVTVRRRDGTAECDARGECAPVYRRVHDAAECDRILP